MVTPGVVDAVEATKEDLHGLLRNLVGFRTESQAKEALHFPDEAKRCVAHVRDFLAELGFSFETWEVGPSATFEAHPLLVGQLPGSGGGRSLAFNGHLDVVPVGDTSAWTQEPFGGSVVNGRLYGRGATDMKGGIAAALWATKVAIESGFVPRGDVYFHLVTDEEVVGNGTREIVSRAPHVDVAISVEPTQLAIRYVEGGLVHFRIEVEGIEAHASTRYLSVHAGGKQAGGVNAIEKLVKIILALQELEREWANTKSHPALPAGYNTLLPGIIVGGPGGGSNGRLKLFSNAGTTPNYCSVEYGTWFYPSETFDDVKAEVEAYIEDVCRADSWLRDHPPRFDWKIGHIYFPPINTPLEHAAVSTMSDCLLPLNLDPTPQGFGAACDLAWYAEEHIPGLILGPGALEQCHVADEYLDTTELLQAAKAYAAFLVKWCG
jgi:acetylornithine deacetylase/succinyl-diaminopimelate desuccinylase family protein